MQVIDFTSADRIMSEGHTSKGDQPKWKQSGNWYKADHMGYEALSEIIVSRLLTWSNADDFVVYQPVFIHYSATRLPMIYIPVLSEYKRSLLIRIMWSR